MSTWLFEAYVENSSGPDMDVNIEGKDITITTVGPPPLPVPTGIKIFANGGDVNLSGSSGAGDNSVCRPIVLSHRNWWKRQRPDICERRCSTVSQGLQ